MTRQKAVFTGTTKTSTFLNVGSVIATGGEIRDFWHNGTYWRAHLFLTSGTFTVTSGGEIEYLVVGGGGGGGMDMGGGGGGGGVLFGSTVINQGSYDVVVGAGGNGAPRAGTGTNSQGRTSHQYTISATSGGNSSFYGVTALGGGYGGSSYFNYTPNNGYGANGASGGGASGYSNGTTGRGGTALNSGAQGYNGGGSSGQYYSGGGGGAGQAGGAGTGSGAAKGGDGLMCDILGVELWWGAGGGGSGYSTNGGNGGKGGGGGGAVGITLGGQNAFNAGMPGGVGSTSSQTNTPGGHAGQNTGSGGGGGSHYAANNCGGDGGDGIVVVRYPLSPGFESPGNVTYETLFVTAQGSGGVTVTGNGTTAVSFFKTSGSSAWDTQVYSLQPFTAPVTLEFNKLASPDFSDNTLSYAMIGLNADPTADNSYTSLDWAAYLYDMDIYSVYHNGSQVNTAGSWSTSEKFYIVYDTDGWIRHYNGSTLLYQVSTGRRRTVYLDSSLNRVNGGYGGFSNVRITKNAWNGSRYVRQAVPEGVVSDGLVFYLDAGDTDSYPGTGTSWFDLSGLGNNATLVNGPTFNSGNGGSIVFDGSNDRCDFVFDSTLDLSQSMTFESFIYPTAYKTSGGGGGMLITKVGSYYTELEGNGKIRFYGYNLSSPGYHSSTGTIPLNQWSHFAVVRNFAANQILFYINGVLDRTVSSITGSITVQQTYPLTLGSYSGSGYEYTGRMSTPRAYNRALSAAEVLQNFNAQRGRFGI